MALRQRTRANRIVGLDSCESMLACPASAGRGCLSLSRCGVVAARLVSSSRSRFWLCVRVLKSHPTPTSPVYIFLFFLFNLSVQRRWWFASRTAPEASKDDFSGHETIPGSDGKKVRASARIIGDSDEVYRRLTFWSSRPDVAAGGGRGVDVQLRACASGFQSAIPERIDFDDRHTRLFWQQLLRDWCLIIYNKSLAKSAQ